MSATRTPSLHACPPYPRSLDTREAEEDEIRTPLLCAAPQEGSLSSTALHGRLATFLSTPIGNAPNTPSRQLVSSPTLSGSPLNILDETVPPTPNPQSAATSANVKEVFLYDAVFTGLYPVLARLQPRPLSYPFTAASLAQSGVPEMPDLARGGEGIDGAGLHAAASPPLPPWRPHTMKRVWRLLVVVVVLTSILAVVALQAATSAQTEHRHNYYKQQAFLFAQRRGFEPYEGPSLNGEIESYVGRRNQREAALFVAYANEACKDYREIKLKHPPYMVPLHPGKSVDGDHWAYFVFCFVAGLLSAIPSLLVTPVDIVKCRLQVGVYTEGFLRGLRDLCWEGAMDGMAAVDSLNARFIATARRNSFIQSLGGGPYSRRSRDTRPTLGSWSLQASGDVVGGTDKFTSFPQPPEIRIQVEGGGDTAVNDELLFLRAPQTEPAPPKASYCSRRLLLQVTAFLARPFTSTFKVIFQTHTLEVEGAKGELCTWLGRRVPTPSCGAETTSRLLPARAISLFLQRAGMGLTFGKLALAAVDDVVHMFIAAVRCVQLVKGFLLAVFAGWQPVCIGYALQGAIKYGFYEFGKFKLGRWLGDEFVVEHHLFIFLMSAMFAEVSADLLLAPWESIKIRLQMAKRRFPFSASFPVIVHVEGVHELYRCLPPVMCRQVPVTSVKFVSYESIVRFFVLRLNALEYLTEVQVALAAGCTAGIICAVITQPADTLVSLVSQGRASGSGDVPVLVLIRRLGLQKLYGGIIPRLVMVAMLTAMQWGIYDGFKHSVGLPTTGSK